VITIKYSIHDMEMKTALKDLSTRLSRPQKALKECGLVLLRSISKTFKAGGRPVRWKPSKRARLTGGRTLIDTARLLRSITMKAAAKSVTWGTNVKYAAMHQLGGKVAGRTIFPKRAKALRWIGPDGSVRFAKKVTIPAFNMPARPFLVIQDADWRVFRKIFEEYLTDER